MEKLNKALRALKATCYLDSKNGGKNNIFCMNFLTNGIRLSEQLQKKWQSTQVDDVSTHLLSPTYTQIESPINRLSFVQSAEFDNVLNFIQKKKIKFPIITKQLLTYQLNTDEETSRATETAIIEFMPMDNVGKFLITDYFVPVSSGLEKFYNIQRERKIWWMTLSANPSRYFLEAYELPPPPNGITNENTGNDATAAAEVATATDSHQSITIKSRFSFGTIAMERLTLVPMSDEPRPNKLKSSATHNLKTVPAVIRSVINLETATCGLLLDANDCKRANTLRLNQKISPHQMMVIGLQAEKTSNDLPDLCAYVAFLIRKAGLRLIEHIEIVDTDNKTSIDNVLQKADSIGIPYTIVVENESLKYGLLKLRSRDTMLHETIHISDIPEYLLKIFSST